MAFQSPKLVQDGACLIEFEDAAHRADCAREVEFEVSIVSDFARGGSEPAGPLHRGSRD
jgi:hypothetical protein